MTLGIESRSHCGSPPRGSAALCAAPHEWRPGARLAVSLVINVEEGAEMSVLHGDATMEPVDELGMFAREPLRNLSNESNYRYGLTRGAARVAGLLRKHGMRATWTCAAQALEAAPHVARLIAEGGHEVCAHGDRWITQLKMDEATEREFIVRARDSIERTTGLRPAGWLSRYYTTLNTRRLLVEAGFDYHMDDFSDDVPFWDGSFDRPILIIPYALDTNDMKMWNHPGYSPDQWLKYACDTFEWLLQESQDIAQARIMSLGVHLRIIGRPGRIGAFQRFLMHVAASTGACVLTRRDIAAACTSSTPLETAA
jgi:peptidoglycan/xylan/chitin deacetylase (PgdA/CDA1 family)